MRSWTGICALTYLLRRPINARAQAPVHTKSRYKSNLDSQSAGWFREKWSWGSATSSGPWSSALWRPVSWPPRGWPRVAFNSPLLDFYSDLNAPQLSTYIIVYLFSAPFLICRSACAMGFFKWGDWKFFLIRRKKPGRLWWGKPSIVICILL